MGSPPWRIDSPSITGEIHHLSVKEFKEVINLGGFTFFPRPPPSPDVKRATPQKSIIKWGLVENAKKQETEETQI